MFVLCCWCLQSHHAAVILAAREMVGMAEAALGAVEAAARVRRQRQVA